MADSIERTIYKLEIDDSAYIKGVDNLSASTQKFTQQQDAANKKLKENEAALKSVADTVEKDRKALENYAGSDTKFRKTLEDNLKASQAQHSTLKKLVDDVRASYERSKKAADDFAQSSNKANGLAGGGRVPVPPVVPQPVPQLIPPAAFEDFDLNDILSQTNIEFEKLRESIAAAELALAGMNEESEEFKQLAPVVDQGKKALADYDAAATKAGTSTLSLRSQIRLGREELVKLEQQGKANTKEYFELEKRVASLTDAFGDQQARIKILASDTKALDFGKGAITAATAAFSAYTSVSVLAGDQSEELQKKTLQLFAAMQLLQSLEQLSNLTRREGVLATLAQAGAQRVYTTVVGASTGAMKAFRIALAATGIGAAVIAITVLIQKFRDLQEAEKAAQVEQKALLDINKQAVDSYAQEVTNLKLLAAEHNNTATSLKRKKEIQDELQKSYPSYFKDLDTQADKEAFVAEQVGKVTQALILQAKVQAAQSLLTQKFSDLLKSQFDPTEAVDFFDAVGSSLRNILGTQADAAIDLSKTAQANVSKAQAEYDKFEKFIIGFVNSTNSELEKLGGDPKKQEKAVKTTKIENVFEEEKNRALSNLAELRRQELEGAERINADFAAKLISEKDRINKLVSSNKLTREQGVELKVIATRANQLELDKALADFNKKVLDAREKLNDELLDLQDKSTEDSLNLIQDEFERRKALIEFNEKQELADAAERQEDRLAALELDKLLLGEQAYQEAKNIIITTGEQEANNIIQRASQQRVQLAIDSFKNILDDFDKAISDADLIGDKAALEEIQALVATFQTGKITYEQYKKDLAAIQKKYEDAQLQKTINILEEEIRVLRRKINNTLNLTEEQYDDLIKLVTQKEKELTEARTKQATGGVKDPDEKSPEVDRIVKFADAMGQLADSVIQFWQAANEAESAALDRSISLQERRVTAAQRIAERGNASYLKQEEDRLKELELIRENAARRQLAIDAALQASQILVAITGAIAKIANPVPGAGIAETIGAIAVIVGSLATGYGLVKSLQGNQPRLAKGDPYVKRNGHPSGVDTIPAWLNEGEAVIPTDKNKQYHPSVRAIYDGSVPAEAMNNFVKNYHSVKSVPRVNYERIKESAEIHLGSDGRMSVAIQEQNKLIVENNELQRMTLRAMKNMSVSANIDRDGVSVMVNEYIQQMNINKKV